MTHQYPDEYFANRTSNDPARLAAFRSERALLERYSDLTGAICDIGCSTGEFLEAIYWQGPRYGTEINRFAIEQAARRGVSFERDVHNSVDFFDVVVFRGTLQHLRDPFATIEAAYRSLKPGGLVAFLMTPNANSLYYKIHNTLPALDAPRNYFIPSDTVLSNVLVNCGFEVLCIEYPYFGTSYARPATDFLRFAWSCVTRVPQRHAFPRSMMDVIARRPPEAPSNGVAQ